ncbi:MAG TPA: hypothetical protein VGP72_10345 [Planctomycetota bacterium]|jgi:hypothetical protein
MYTPPAAVVHDLDDSSYDFARLVWPAVAPLLGGGELIQVETAASSDFAMKLDRLAGIDAIQALDGRLYGLATRVQWGKSYGGYSVRWSRASGNSTEFAKRLESIRASGSLYPHWTIQAYCSEPRTGHLLAAAACRTADLIGLLADGQPGRDFRVITNKDGGSSFAAVSWSAMITRGLAVHVVGGGAQTKTASVSPAVQVAVNFDDWLDGPTSA